MADADEDARLVALFMQQQLMIEALLATRSQLLKQHDNCLDLVAQMSELSVDVSTAAAVPYTGGSKKRRGVSEDERGSTAADDWESSESMGDEPLVYRSCSPDGDGEGGDAEPGSLERQVSLLTRMLAALEQPEWWDEARSAAVSVAWLRELSAELLAVH